MTKNDEDYDPARIDINKRNTREEIIRYLSLHGLKCVALGEENQDYLEIGRFYVMKPHESLQEGLRFNKPKDKKYLPDYKQMLEHDFYMFYLELGDDDEYSVIITTVDTELLKKEYSWIENYDGLLFIITDIPEKGSRIAFPSDFKGGGQNEPTKEKILHDDPYLKGLDVDPEEFYTLVDQIQKEMSGTSKSQVDDYNDEFMDGDAINGEAFEKERKIDWNVFKEHGMVYKFISAYFDVGEYFSWVTAKAFG